MPEGDFQEKTEKATPKRRSEAREKGQVARSRELSSVAVLGVALILAYFAGAWLIDQLGRVVSTSIGGIATRARQDPDMATLALQAGWGYLRLILPIMGAVAIAAILVNLLQVGFLFSAEPVMPKLSRIDPLKGAQRLLSRQALAELLKSLGKIAVVGWVAYLTLKGEMENLPPLVDMSCGQISIYLGNTMVKIMVRGFWVMLVLALLDYGYQRWEYEKNLMMSKQELKEEYRQTEGDPLIRGRIRSIQRAMARRRMMAEVPKADVVITNPEHVAVALRYDAKAMAAPTVVAKGANLLAQRIKAVAMEHQVPLVEDKPLAQNLYRLVDVGKEIPAALYRAVAAILAHVYRLRGRMSA
jgi:flagellar biosynthesis protein FlhB